MKEMIKYKRAKNYEENINQNAIVCAFIYSNRGRGG